MKGATYLTVILFFLKIAKAHFKKKQPKKHQNQTHNLCADNRKSLSYIRKLTCFLLIPVLTQPQLQYKINYFQ